MDKRGIIFILAGSLLWGTTGTTQALAPDSAQPLAIGAMRMLVSGAALMLYFFLTGGRWNIARQDLPAFALGAACMAAYQVCFFAGVRLTGVAVGTIVGIGISPVVAGLLGLVFQHENPGARWVWATLLAVGGCTLLALAGGSGVRVDPLGMLLAAAAGTAYAVFSLVGKRLFAAYSVELVMAFAFGGAALLLAPLLPFVDLSWLAQPRGLAAVLWLALAATAAAYILFGKGLRRVPLASAVTLSLAEPLTAGLLGIFLLDERLNLQMILGMLLIFAGLAVLSFHRMGKKIPAYARQKQTPS